MSKEIKLTVVGDSHVGKTCMLISYTTNSFPTEYVPTVFDNYITKGVFEGNPVDMVLFDTAGDSEYDSLRPVNYPGTNVFLICFSVVSHSTADGILKKWLDEVRGACPDAPFIVIGTKIDLRQNEEELKKLKEQQKTPITPEQGAELAKIVGAHKYIECSALTQEGLAKVFEESMKVALYPKPLPKIDVNLIEKLKKTGKFT